MLNDNNKLHILVYVTGPVDVSICIMSKPGSVPYLQGGSDVDRGQTPEDEAEDKTTRPRTIFLVKKGR